MSDSIEKVSTLLYEPEYRQKWRRVYGQMKYNKMEEKLAILDSQKTLNILEGAKYAEGTEISVDQLKAIAREFRSRQKLRYLEL